MSEILQVLPAVFIASSLVLLVAKRFSVPAYSAYIVTGFLLSAGSSVFGEALPGPEVLGSGALVGVAEVGAAFLIFVAAVRVSPRRIGEFGMESLKASSVQIFIQHAIGFIAGLFLGLTTVESFFLGFTASISSSLVSLDLIEEEARLDVPYGRLTESISLIDDAIAAIITVVILSGAVSGSVLAVFVGAAFVIVPYMLRDEVADTLLSEFRGDPEIMLLIGVSAVVLMGYASQALGVNPVVGVFGAGLLLSREPVNLALVESLRSVKDFFSAVFFVSLGALVQVPNATALWVSAVLLFSVILVRPLAIVGVLRSEGFDSYTSYKTALSLDQVSEFTLLAALLARGSGLLSAQIFEAVVFSAAITFVTSDLTTRYSDTIYGSLPGFLRFERIVEADYGFNDREGHSIVVGYGDPGRAAAEALDDVVVMATNPHEVEEAKRDGRDVLLGDPMHRPEWIRAGIEGANRVVSTVEDDRRARKAAETGKKCVLITGTEKIADELVEMDNVLRAGTADSYASKSFRQRLLELTNTESEPK